MSRKSLSWVRHAFAVFMKYEQLVTMINIIVLHFGTANSSCVSYVMELTKSEQFIYNSFDSMDGKQLNDT